MTCIDDGMLRIREHHQELRAAVAHVLSRDELSRGSRERLRVAHSRPSALDRWRERVTQWRCEEPRLTAKRIRRLPPMAGPVPARTVRRYIAALRAAARRKEAFVHRGYGRGGRR